MKEARKAIAPRMPRKIKKKVKASYPVRSKDLIIKCRRNIRGVFMFMVTHLRQ